MERTFNIWKNRFCILRGIPEYSIQKQRVIIIACVVLHKLIKLFSDEESVFDLAEDQDVVENNDQDAKSFTQQQNDDGNGM